MSIVTQTQSGKSYEYACLLALQERISAYRSLAIEENESVRIARAYFEGYPESERTHMYTSALSGIDTIIKLEPRLIEPSEHQLIITLQIDSQGVEGDVRDVVVRCPHDDWEIGLSVKNNHHDIKHPRISPTIDFGKSWFGLPCSQEYMDEIAALFARLDPYIEKGARWRDVAHKEELFYIPALNLFKNELNRLDRAYPKMVPQRLMEYLIGRKDFHKIIALPTKQLTLVQSFNIHASLNKKSVRKSPLISLAETKIPDTVYFFDFRINADEQQSKTTLQMVLNEDWAISFRLHSASTRVEKSMKFAVQLTGVPASLFVNYDYWGENNA